MARVVVTGGSGFIGSHLVERLVADGHDVVVYDGAPPPPDQADLPMRRVSGDIRDAASLGSVVTPGVDVVYHLSAVVGVDRYLSQPLDVLDVNILGTRNVLELASAAGARVVVASTSEVYGRNPNTPWAEDDDRVLGSTSADRWSYSSSKAVAEHLAFAFARQRGLAASIVRFFNVYGPRQRPAYVLSRNIHRALRGIAPVVYDTGNQTRCFTFVGDAVAGTILAGTSPKAEGECFNIGSHVETSIEEAVGLVAELTGNDSSQVRLDTGESFGSSYDDIPRRVPDTTKAGLVLDWRCETQLREGIEHTVEWARRNQWWLDLPADDSV